MTNFGLQPACFVATSATNTYYFITYQYKPSRDNDHTSSSTTTSVQMIYVEQDLGRLKSKLPPVHSFLSITLLFWLTTGLTQLPVDVIWKENPKTGEIIYTASCPEPGLYSIEVDVKMKGLTADHPLPLQVALWGPFKDREILRLTRVRADLGYSTRSTYRVAQGDVLNVHPDDDHLYWLPFEPGVNVTVFQGFNGSFSHRRDYAIDLDVPEGTPITATRDGVVIGSRESSNRRCAEERCASYGNFILIQHADGTIGNYVHLQKDGVLVEIGDSVEAGQLIGYSGNTGWSTGPHLHFDVSVPEFSGRKTIPFQLMDATGKGRVPKEGESYSRQMEDVKDR